MTLGSFLITLLEISGAVALVWCIFHESRLVAFEEKVFAAIRRKRLRVVRTDHSHSYNI